MEVEGNTFEFVTRIAIFVHSSRFGLGRRVLFASFFFLFFFLYISFHQVVARSFVVPICTKDDSAWPESQR